MMILNNRLFLVILQKFNPRARQQPKNQRDLKTYRIPV